MNIKFLKYFIITIGLHVIWDMPISTSSQLPFVQIILTITAWIIVIIFISVGLKQISNLNYGAKKLEEREIVKQSRR